MIIERRRSRRKKKEEKKIDYTSTFVTTAENFANPRCSRLRYRGLIFDNLKGTVTNKTIYNLQLLFRSCFE